MMPFPLRPGELSDPILCTLAAPYTVLLKTEEAGEVTQKPSAEVFTGRGVQSGLTHPECPEYGKTSCLVGWTSVTSGDDRANPAILGRRTRSSDGLCTCLCLGDVI